MFCSGYVTRFLFTSSLCEDYDQDVDNNHDDSERRCCHHQKLHNIDYGFCQCHLYGTVNKQSSDDSQCSRNKHSLEHVYDDDGDMVVKRKCHQQSEVINIG